MPIFESTENQIQIYQTNCVMWKTQKHAKHSQQAAEMNQQQNAKQRKTLQSQKNSRIVEKYIKIKLQKWMVPTFFIFYTQIISLDSKLSYNTFFSAKPFKIKNSK